MEYIVQHIGEVIKTIQDENGVPYYFYGHRSKVNVVLSTMDKDKVRKKLRYPAIILWMDIDEKPVDMFWQYTLNISIVAPTLNQAFVGDRLAATFYPLLIPIYDKFIDALGNTGIFFWDGRLLLPPHTRTLRPYWGLPTPERNRAFYLDDKLDAIEIRNLVLNYEPICKETAESGFILTETGYLKR